MMCAKAGIIALAIGAGLVGPASFADAQITPKWKCAPSSLGGDLGAKWSEFECASSLLLGDLQVLQTITTVEFLRSAQTDPGGPGAAMKKQQAQWLNALLIRRDAAATALGDAITETMKTMNPNNPQDGKRLDQIFDQIQAINKDVTDAQLRYSDSLASLEEQAAADAQKQ